MRFPPILGLIAALGGSFVATVARAQVSNMEATPLQPLPPPPQSLPPPPLPPPEPVAIATLTPPELGPPAWMLAVGVRTMYIRGAAYDPFSGDDGFVQFSMAGTRSLLTRNRSSLAAGIGLDAGSSSDQARGNRASLGLIRLSPLVEGRYQPIPRLYVFGRLAPGFLHGSASIADASAPGGSTLTTSFDTFSLDVAAGAALRIGSSRVGFGFWLTADGGYGWVPAQRLVLAPSLGSDQDKAGSLDLGSLAPRGGFFRIAAALSYN